MKWVPAGFQKSGMKFILKNQVAVALFLDPGLRKTSTVLGALKILKAKGIVQRVLIVAPMRVCYNVWPLEMEKWDDFHDFTFTLLHGQYKEDNLHDDVDIYLLNPEGLGWFIQAKGMRIIKPDTLIVDESTKFKNWTSGRTKQLKKIIHLFHRRLIMTGGPIPKTMMDIFSQMYICDMGRSLGRYITHFRNEFFHSGGYGDYDWILNKGADKRIEKRIKPHVFRIPPKEHLKLPRVIPVPVYIDLPPKVRKMYDSMEEELFIKLGRSTTLIAANNAVASVKCRQIASGAIYTDKNNKRWKKIHDEKIIALEDLIDELAGRPVFIAYYFRHELERIRKSLGKNLPSISDCSAKEGVALNRAWNNNELNKLAGHPASIGHGLNLQESDCQHIIIFSQTWNFDDHDQLIKRFKRSGSPHDKLFLYLLMVRDTVEEVMMESNVAKGNRQQRFLKTFERYRKQKTGA